MKKRIFNAALTLAMIVGILPSTMMSAFATEREEEPQSIESATLASASNEFAGGSGTAADPWLIATETQFEILASYVINDDAVHNANTAYYLLIDNLSVGNAAIGTETHQFKGNFDGGYKNINVAVVETDYGDDYAGLFGVVGSKGTVKNLSVTGSVTLSQYSQTRVTELYAGGIVGYNNGGFILNCTSYVKVSASADTTQSVAYGGDSTLINRTDYTYYNNYTATAYAGGIVGRNNGTVCL